MVPSHAPRSHSHARRRATAGLALAATLAAAGCGSTVTHVDAPKLTVVTSLYPLAQAVSEVGGSQVQVVDLATAGVNPATMTLDATERREVRQAALVVDIGRGFQPAVESAAATSARRTLPLLPALGGTNPYIWLDPVLMEKVAPLIASALTRAEPAARKVFADGAEDLQSEASSLDIDFQSTLSVCPDTTFVTSNDAFARMAGRYGLTDHAAGTAAEPSPAQVRTAASAITAARSITAFSEPYVDAALISDAAETAGVKVKTLNTIETPPASGSRAEVSYSNLMETDLTALTSALQCPTDTGS